ncbi:hypothetical protein L249_1192 [Ophiocordyceps polyrhachis-furcata BCC 54312]|uniref:Uncharacterized protein n=1 Tax=Ophiocordyceps polyrhachis-furcata BCC 54312 TaxID=1330021 RepID=A0A367LFR9_9HYPO|nr:hypothetical protein L249_1192 [Ophiocordyceps polyrhachis-furcata BCC 54312]
MHLSGEKGGQPRNRYGYPTFFFFLPTHKVGKSSLNRFRRTPLHPPSPSPPLYVNTSKQLKTDDFAWQSRKAFPFALAPFFCSPRPDKRMMINKNEASRDRLGRQSLNHFPTREENHGNKDSFLRPSDWLRRRRPFRVIHRAKTNNNFSGYLHIHKRIMYPHYMHDIHILYLPATCS